MADDVVTQAFDRIKATLPDLKSNLAGALSACQKKTMAIDRLEERIGTWLDGRRVSLPGSGYNNPSIWRFASEPGSRIDAGWTDIGMNNPGGWPEAGG